MSRPDLDVTADPKELAARIGAWLVKAIGTSTGRFALNLSGGSTPKALYQLLATEHYRRAVNWERVHFFFGDERFVPHDHPDSNYGMANAALISKIPVPPENVHPVDTAAVSPDAAAAAYEQELQRFYGKATLDLERPLFSVTLLGLGDDGHTASLFPGSPALLVKDRWVTAATGGERPEPRITLTYPAIASSGTVAFLVAGAAKHAMLTRLMNKDPALPSAQVETRGRLIVFCDEAAAGSLADKPA